METTPFELTPEQKSMLESLACETGKEIPTLLAKALEELQERLHSDPGQWAIKGSKVEETGSKPMQTKKHIWEIAAELLENIPEEELEQLPAD